MPNSLGAKKRLRQNISRRDQNRSYRSSMRTQIKKVREAIAAGDVEKAQAEFKLACVSLDKAASRNIIHDNKAARTKSRLSKAIREAGAAAS